MEIDEGEHAELLEEIDDLKEEVERLTSIIENAQYELNKS